MSVVKVEVQSGAMKQPEEKGYANSLRQEFKEQLLQEIRLTKLSRDNENKHISEGSSSSTKEVHKSHFHWQPARVRNSLLSSKSSSEAIARLLNTGTDLHRTGGDR